jgi:oxygen-independent coproporphyrinogen-3 oxidase
MTLSLDLLHYHSSGNRFVYFPTTSNWNNEAKEVSTKEFSKNENVNLYIHLPFCRELCTFCGCNIKISQKKEEHLEYIETVIKEFELKGGNSAVLTTLTLGGGTPNILHPEAKLLLKEFLRDNLSATLMDAHVELEPKTFSKEDYDYYKSIGINRFSFGIQDFSEKICANVNRHQTPKEILNAFEILNNDDCKGIDLIWGLPFQSKETVEEWRPFIEKVDPDWISFYPLAQVPWLKAYQNAYGDFSLPTKEEKIKIYVTGASLFEELGFIHFGFGHFIKKDGLLGPALKEKTLTRLVSGLYPNKVHKTLALGVGAISDFGDSLHQNFRILEKYKHTVLAQKKIPTEKCHQLDSKNLVQKAKISEVISQNRVSLSDYQSIKDKFPTNWFDQADETISISPYGRHFLAQILKELI